MIRANNSIVIVGSQAEALFITPPGVGTEPHTYSEYLTTVSCGVKVGSIPKINW